MNKKYVFMFFSFFLLIGVLSSYVFAAPTETDVRVFSGIELDNVITLISSIFSLILFVLTLVAYKRSKRDKLIYISVAFLLFAIKGFLLTSDSFIQYTINYIDPLANLLDFVILLCFFFGMIKK